MKQPSNSARHSRLLIIGCWLVYMSAYIGRNTFKASIAPIATLGLMTNAQAGLIETCYFILYGAGHLINGIMADRLNPMKMIGIGLVGSALANMIMGFSPPYVVMLIVWAVNGYLQAMLWSPILALFSRVIDPNMQEGACFSIFTSSPVGTILAYLIVALTSGINFRITFFAAATILFLIAIVFFLIAHATLPHLRSWKKAPLIPEIAVTSTESLERISWPLLILKTGIPCIVLATILHGMLKEGILTWVPSLITDTYAVPVAFSVLLSMLLPLSNLCGAALSKFCYHRFFGENEVKTGCFFMLVTLVPIFAVSRMASLPLALSALCLALISMLMTSFNYMVSTVIPMRFSGYGKPATFSGIFNSSVYLGSAISTWAFGNLADQMGWGFTTLTWGGIAICGVILLLAVNRAWKRFSGK